MKECLDEDDLERALAHEQVIESLTLVGPWAEDGWISDAVLERLPAVPRLRRLHIAGGLRGDGLDALGRQPELAALTLLSSSELSLETIARMPNLRELEVWTPKLSGLARLRVATPGLAQLSIGVDGSDGFKLPRFDRVESLSLRLPSLRADTLILDWPALTRLSLDVRELSDGRVARLIKQAPCLRALHLRGCPVGDETVRAAATIPTLEYIDVVDTNVSKEGLTHLYKARPTLRVHPRRSG